MHSGKDAIRWFALHLVLTCLVFACARGDTAEKPNMIENDRILVLDDFRSDLGAWEPAEVAVGSVRIVPDDLSDSPVLEWSLGDVGGGLTYRRMDRIEDFGRYNRIRLRVRAWDNEGREGVGCAARAGMRISGYPKHKADRIPSWGFYDRRPEPSRKWRTLNEYMDFPDWYPWGKKDNTEKGFWLTASAGFSHRATMRIDEICLIDDAIEVHGGWGRLEEREDGSAVWHHEITLINRTDRPQRVRAEVAEPALSKFRGELGRRELTVPPRATITLDASVSMPHEVVEDAPALYHEDLFVRVIPQDAPATSTTVRLPATVPLGIAERPCLLTTAEQWKEKRKDFQGLEENARKRRLRDADGWLEKEIVLPDPYPVTREVKLVDGTVRTLPEHPWSGVKKSKAAWQKHRALFRAVKTLGEAYRLTLDRRYAEKAAEIVRAYAENLDRYPLRGITTGREKGWARFAINNLHEGWHIMPMTYGYDMILDAPGVLTEEEKDAIARDLLIPLAASETPIVSWFSNQTSVRYMAAALCGFNAGNSNFVHFAVFGHHGLQRGISASINRDGFMTEIPLNYHWANLIEMLNLAVVLRNTGMEIPYRRDLLEKACRVPYLRAFPNGHVVGFGPHGYGRGPGYYPKHYRTVSRLFDDPVFQKLADPKKGRELISHLDSVHFPHTELIVLRQGEGEDQHAINFLFGNKRRAHDAATAFTWYGEGRLLAPAVGSLYNVTSPDGAWISPFYCQVNVDDRHQVAATGELTYHRFGDGPQIASARADHIFPGVEVERTLVLHDGMVFIADRMVSEKEHAYQWAYLSRGELSTAGRFTGETITDRNGKMTLTGRRTDSGWHAEWNAGGRKLRATMAACPGTQVLSGDSYISPATAQFRRPLVLARRRARKTVFLTVLEPYDESPRVESVQPEPLDAPQEQAAVLRVSTPDRTYVFVLNYAETPLQGADWKCRERVGLIEVE